MGVWFARESGVKTNAISTAQVVRSPSGRARRFLIISPLAAALVTFLCLILSAPAAEAGEYVQYGSKNPTGSATARGIRSTISISEVFSANYATPIARFYWPGVTFSNGIFFQAGFEDAGETTGCQTLEYFSWAFDGAGTPFKSDRQDCVPVAPQSFSMTNIGAVGNGNYFWQARAGSADIGSPIQKASAFPLSRAGAVSEVSSTGSWAVNYNPRISKVRYDPAIEFQLVDGTWHNQAIAKVYRANGGDFRSPCPPYRVGSGTFNTMVSADSGTITCKSDGDPLW